MINSHIHKNKYILDTWKLLSIRKISTKIDMLSAAYVTSFIFLSVSFIYCSLHIFPHFLFFASVFNQIIFFLRLLFHFSKLLHFIHSLRRIFKQDFQGISRRVKCCLLIPQSYKNRKKVSPVINYKHSTL